jgi:iron complex outermembrane receptor protein
LIYILNVSILNALTEVEQEVHVIPRSLRRSFMFLLLSSSLEASSGKIDGVVLDPAGSPLAGVQVVVARERGNPVSATTDGAGRFRFEALEPGSYQWTATLDGLAPASGEVEVSPEGTSTITIPMLLATAETVLVQGLAPERSTTAGRIELPLRDVPQSIQVVPQRLIEEQAAIRASEAITNASGVVRGTGFGNTTDEFFVRGFRVNHIYKDGVSNRFFSGFAELTNVDRIEVLKGPSSALYGQAEPGGIVNIISKRPLFSPRFSFDLQGGSDDFYKFSADLTGPLSDSRTLAGRLTASYENSGSFREFIETERWFLAPSLRWLASPGVSLTVYGEVLDQNRPPDAGIPVIGRNPVAIPASRNLGEPYEVGEYETYLAGGTATFQLPAAWALHVTGRHFDVYDHSIYTFPFPNEDNRTALRYAFEPVSEGRTSDLTVEGTSSGATGGLRHNLLVGFEARWLENSFRNRFAPIDDIDMFAPVHGSPPPSFPPYEDEPPDETSTVGAYAQDLIDLSQSVKLLAGVRLDRIHDELSAQTDTAVSPRIGLVYQPTGVVSLYGSYSSAFVPNLGRSFAGDEFDPERSRQVEAGVKLGPSGGRVWLTAAFYHLTRDDVLTGDLDHPGFSLQVGEQRSRGLEVDLTGDFGRGWSATLAYAYTDAVVTEDTRIREGNRLANIPEHSGRLWTTYRLRSGRAAGLGFGGGVAFQGGKQGDVRNTFDVPAFERLDAVVFFEREKWRLSLNAINLLDEEYFEVGGLNVLLPAPPRGFLLSLGFRL